MQFCLIFKLAIVMSKISANSEKKIGICLSRYAK